MPTQVQFRRGTTVQNNSFTGAVGEVSVDIDKDTLRIHDGTTQGGFEQAKVNLTNVSGAVNLSLSGIITATTFVGALTGTATSTTNIPNLSGDITSANTVTTLATVNSNVGTFGSGGAIPSITVNAKGLITGVTTTAVTSGTTITDDTSTNASRFLTFTSATSGSISAANVSSTKLTFNPSTGSLSATTFIGALTGTASSTTNIPNLTGAITSVNTTTSLGSFTSAQLATALTDETGSGVAVFATSPTLVTPVLGSATATSLNVSGISTFTNGPILVGTGTSTGTASQPLQVTGGAYVSGSVGIGTTNPTYKLHVVGSFGATTKSFIIDHPTKEGKKLQYGSLEGPELGVYIRGRTQESIIELPDYWTGLVHEETITVNITAIGNKNIWVEKIEDNKVYINSKDEIDCFYTIFGERKDVAKLEVEM